MSGTFSMPCQKVLLQHAIFYSLVKVLMLGKHKLKIWMTFSKVKMRKIQENLFLECFFLNMYLTLGRWSMPHKKHIGREWGRAQLINCSLCKHKDQSSSPKTHIHVQMLCVVMCFCNPSADLWGSDSPPDRQNIPQLQC